MSFHYIIMSVHIYYAVDVETNIGDLQKKHLNVFAIVKSMKIELNKIAEIQILKSIIFRAYARFCANLMRRKGGLELILVHIM